VHIANHLPVVAREDVAYAKQKHENITINDLWGGPAKFDSVLNEMCIAVKKKAKQETMSQQQTQTICLQIPSEYILPEFYSYADPSTTAEAITIGANLHAILHKKHTDDRIQEIEAQKTAEIAAIRAATAAQLTELSVQTDALKTAHAARLKELTELQAVKEAAARHDETERLTRSHTQKIRELQTELSELQERNAALQARRVELETSRDTDIARAEESTKSLLQYTLDEKQRSLERLEKEKDRLATILEKQTAEIQNLNEFIRRKPTANVKTKGNDFEAAFRAKLVQSFGVNPQFEIEDSARNSVGHAGDFKMKWGSHTVLWECKDYDKPIPSAEVEKFKRDMKENPDVRVGVMISRFTPIVGKTGSGDRHIEFLDGKMHIYMSQFEDMSEDSLKQLMPLFQFWWESDRNTESEESRINAIRQIEKLYATAVKARMEWRVHKSRMEETLRWIAETVEENEHRLQQALNVLNGSVSLLKIPEGIFRSCDGDERATQLIQFILEVCEPAPDSSILMNDLAECAAKKQLISASTAKTHIKSVLLDTVIDSPKGKPTKLRGLAFRTMKNVLEDE
jgi:hypothetical protein